MVVSGHTHQAYNCEIDGKVVTSASSFGRLVTDIDLQIDRRTGDVLTATADNVVVDPRRRRADPAQTALIARYRTLLGPIATEVGRRDHAPRSPGPGALPGAGSRRWATSSPTPSSPPPTTSRARWPPS